MSEEKRTPTIERSLLIIKPDGVARGLIGKVLQRFEEKGFQMIGSKFLQASKEQLADHYAEHYERDYYPSIEASMTMGPIFVFALEGGPGTVEVIRRMLGKTDPIKADPGTIRGDFCMSTGRNVCHASDSPVSAERELKIWFNENELVNYVALNHDLIYRD